MKIARTFKTAVAPLTRWRTALLCAWALGALSAQAEDIDLYMLGSGSSAAPNVLFLLDNTSNWSANNQAWEKSNVLAKCRQYKTSEEVALCEGYVREVFGNANSLTQGQVELRALKLVVNELVCSTSSNGSTRPAVNIGLMMLSANKGNLAGDDNSWVGGWILKAVKPRQDEASCKELTDALDRIDAKISDPAYKAASNAHYGGALFEAFKYFGGYAGPQGIKAPVGSFGYGPTRYTAPYSEEDPAAFVDEGTKRIYRQPSGAVCGKNYIVLIGNTFPNLEPEDNASPRYDKVLKRLGYADTPRVGATGNTARYADEWTQFLATADASDADGEQAIFTYTVNVFNDKENTDQTKLLQSMAAVGGTGSGGYYEVGGDLKALVDALKGILSKIAAIDSVFASAALPVSVNTQGTFLNQVFIGMFRPDAEKRPRWSGNLKQYQMAVNSSGDLYLADRNRAPALNNAGTGFMQNCATSFWTTDSGTYWEGVPTSQTPLGACPTSTYEKTSDAPDGPIVEKGGVGQKLRQADPAQRVVRTCSDLACSSEVDFNLSAARALARDLRLDEPSDDLVAWIRGANTGDGPAGDAGYQFYGKTKTVTRPTVHGDVVHARPLAINYGSGDSNQVVVFYGAGDGLLHAVDGSQASGGGVELWSFLAPEFFGRLERLRENSPPLAFNSPSSPDRKDYFFDGGIGAYQERNAEGGVEKVYLYPSMRRGGRQIYAFEANVSPHSRAPRLMWKFGCPYKSTDDGCASGASAIGQTWSTPRPIRVKGDDTLYLVFGGGYDDCEDTNSCETQSKGRGIFVLNAVTGRLATYIDLGAMPGVVAGRVVADIVPVDVNGDGYTDLLYAVDTRGHVWRTNVSNPSGDNPYTGYAPTSWASHTRLIAKVADWSAEARRRKFQYAPDVVVLGGTANIFVGTGDREQPLPGSAASKVRNRFYGLRDNYADGAYEGAPAVSVIDDHNDCDPAGDATLKDGCHLLNVTTLSTSLDYNPALQDPRVRGWVFDLNSTEPPYEQVVTSPVTVGGVVYFSTFQAKNGSDSNVCSNLGTARGYAVNFLTGGLRPGDKDRAAEFVGGGLPPSPVAGIVEIGDRKYPFILGGRQPGKGSSLEGGKVPVHISPVRKKIYRYQKIDK